MAKLGAVQLPLTLPQSVIDFDLDASNRQAISSSHCFPSSFKSKTANAANFMEANAYMSATDAHAPKGCNALGRCGRTALPPTI